MDTLAAWTGFLVATLGIVAFVRSGQKDLKKDIGALATLVNQNHEKAIAATEALRTELKGDIEKGLAATEAVPSELKSDITALRTELSTVIEKGFAASTAARDEIKSDFNTQVQDVRTEFRGRLDHLNEDIRELRIDVRALRDHFTPRTPRVT